ncbi:MAG: DUF6056 family protein [Lachnospiraceae bacterium]|nr:DUF6056 family protein [Lachnospiraceae bacterium]
MKKTEGKIALNGIFNSLELFVQRNANVFTLLVYASTIILLFVMHWVFPYRVDDYIYLNVIGSDRPVQSISDIVESQYVHYFIHGGRTVGHSLEQLLLFIGKPQSCVMMSLAFVSLVVLMMTISGKKDVFHFMEYVGLLYFLNPEFKETICWYDGNANYMWTMIFVLIALIPWISTNTTKMNTLFWRILFIPISFVAGWTNENIAPTVLLLMIYVYLKENIKEHEHNYWRIVYLVMMACGTSLLLLAPGNYVRIEDHSQPLWMELAYRGHGQVNAWCNWLLPVFLLLFISVRFLKSKRMDLSISSKLLGYGGVISVLVMAISPNYPSRATFGSLCLLMIAFVVNVDLIVDSNETWSRIRHGSDILLWIGFMGTVISMVVLQYVRNMGVYIPGPEW